MWEDWLDTTWPEFVACADGACPHVEDGAPCEYETEREEQLGELDPELVADMRIALELARRYKPDHRPDGWSIELTLITNIAAIVASEHRRMKDEQARKKRDGDGAK